MAEVTDFDELDRRIIVLMSSSSEGSFRQIAKELGVHPTTLIQRVKNLQAKGVIKGSRAKIDYMKLGFGGRDKLGRVDRIDPFRPSKTIIAGGTGGGGRSHLHPYIPRTMSVRECARLQTFPDSYEFTGPVARQFTQVGNAVPPVLAYIMAKAIHESIYAPLRRPSVPSIVLSRIEDVAAELPCQVEEDTGQLLMAMEGNQPYDSGRHPDRRRRKGGEKVT